MREIMIGDWVSIRGSFQVTGVKKGHDGDQVEIRGLTKNKYVTYWVDVEKAHKLGEEETRIVGGDGSF